MNNQPEDTSSEIPDSLPWEEGDRVEVTETTRTFPGDKSNVTVTWEGEITDIGRGKYGGIVAFVEEVGEDERTAIIHLDSDGQCKNASKRRMERYEISGGDKFRITTQFGHNMGFYQGGSATDAVEAYLEDQGWEVVRAEGRLYVPPEALRQLGGQKAIDNDMYPQRVIEPGEEVATTVAVYPLERE